MNFHTQRQILVQFLGLQHGHKLTYFYIESSVLFKLQKRTKEPTRGLTVSWVSLFLFEIIYIAAPTLSGKFFLLERRWADLYSQENYM